MGKRISPFSLTSSEAFSSPYYLKQMILYMSSPIKHAEIILHIVKVQFNISVASTIVSAISVIASLTIALLVK